MIKQKAQCSINKFEQCFQQQNIRLFGHSLQHSSAVMEIKSKLYSVPDSKTKPPRTAIGGPGKTGAGVFEFMIEHGAGARLRLEVHPVFQLQWTICVKKNCFQLTAFRRKFCNLYTWFVFNRLAFVAAQFFFSKKRWTQSKFVWY